jgi:hypothetical protein
MFVQIKRVVTKEVIVGTRNGGRLLTLGCQYLHITGNNVNSCTLYAILASILTLLNTSLNENLHAFAQVLATSFSELTPGNDVKPFRFFLPLAGRRFGIPVDG